MATNWDGANSIAGGIREAMTTYMTMKNQNRQEKLLENQMQSQDEDRAMKMTQSGLIKAPDGSIQMSPEAKAAQARKGLIEQAGLLKSGYRIGKGVDGQEVLEKIPGFEDIDDKYKKARIKEIENRGGNVNLTPGEKAFDISASKELSEYGIGGGRGVIEKNLKLLESAITDLESGKAEDRSGGVSGMIGDRAMDLGNPKASATRDKIRSAVQGSLKQILGGQYTEKEGQDIFNRAYNPRLSNSENIRRVKAELDYLRDLSTSKDSAAKYFAERGTMKGMSNQGAGLLPSANAGTGGKIKVSNGKEVLMIYPSDESAAAKEGFKRMK